MTLTEASHWSRRVGVLVVAGLSILVMFGYITSRILNPPVDIKEYLQPTFACTVSATEFESHKLVIPTLQLGSGSLNTISIDTPTGAIESLPLVANVYNYANQPPSLNARQKAIDIGEVFGFNGEDIQRRGTIEYYWNQDEWGRSLAVNANTLNYTLSTDVNAANAYPSGEALPSTETAVQAATSILRSNGWLLEDYAIAEPTTTLIDVRADGKYAQAASRQEAELIRVDFQRQKPFITFRNDVEGASDLKTQLQKEYLDYAEITETQKINGQKVELHSFVTDVHSNTFHKSNISVYIGPEYRRGNNFNSRFLYAIDYAGWVIDSEPCGTYPLLSAAQVTEVIKSGNASLIYLNEEDGDTVSSYRPQTVDSMTVKQVSLGYLDREDKQEFLQPIYFVLGEAALDGGRRGVFLYYIPAIDYANIKDPVPIDPATLVEEEPAGFF